jgi:hypothetical protein
VRRWWRLVWPYVRRSRGLHRFARALLLSYIFLKVSRFERDHARQKVFAVTRLNRLRLLRTAA